MTNAVEKSIDTRLTCPIQHQQLVRKHLLRNYCVIALDLALYMGGMRFLATAIILPVLINDLGGPKWVQAAMPTIGMIGMSLLPVVIAHRLEGLRRMVTLHWRATNFTGSGGSLPVLSLVRRASSMVFKGSRLRSLRVR